MKSQYKNYKISIIIPNYNGEHFIGGCLESIFIQEYENYEIIVVDGKSTDTSHSIIEKYLQKYPDKIRWLNIIDWGISQGFNLWIAAATGEFVLLLWSDDYLYVWIFEKLNTFINLISQYSTVNIEKSNFYCDSINYWSLEKKFTKRIPQTDSINRENLSKYGNIIGFQNIYINRKWFNNFKINEKNKYSMDYESYFEMLHNKQEFIHFPEINSINYLGDNTTCKYWYQSQKEANGVAFKNAIYLKDYIYIVYRYFVRETLRWIRWKE